MSDPEVGTCILPATEISKQIDVTNDIQLRGSCNDVRKVNDKPCDTWVHEQGQESV